MNVRLQYNLEFAGCIHMEHMLQVNQYQINLGLETQSTDRQAINVAMDRLKCFIKSELADAVFINQAHSDLAEVLQMVGANVVTLPEEPVDQIVGLMLFCKLNAIMEGVMVVTTLDICSTLGDEVWYEHTEEDAIGPLADEGWWHLADTTHNNLTAEEPGDNVVKVPSNSWATEYGLMWPDAVDKTPKSKHTVVYAKFPKNEN